MTTSLDLVCPHCRNRTGAMSDAGGTERSPEPGDAAICINCGEWAVLDEAGRALRKPTGDEAAALEASPRAAIVRRAWELAFLPARGRA
jgi:hypothetical protein